MRALLAALLFVACTPSNITPPPDATDAAPTPPSANVCAAACAALAGAHCPEGAAATCSATMQKINDDHLIRAPGGQTVTCASVSSVSTPAQARAAGITCAIP
jgi:hypothetical protein